MGTNGASLTLAKMDEMIDTIKAGRPDLLLMSKRSRRKLSALRRASGNLLETDADAFGRRALFYDGIPVGVSDWISNAITQGSSSDTSRIFALKFGMDGVIGLSGPGLIQVDRIGRLETADADRTRVKWYVSWALFSTWKLGSLIGVRD